MMHGLQTNILIIGYQSFTCQNLVNHIFQFLCIWNIYFLEYEFFVTTKLLENFKGPVKFIHPFSLSFSYIFKFARKTSMNQSI